MDIADLKSRLRSVISLNGFLILLYAVGLGFFFIGMPKYYDDFLYMRELKSWFDMQGIENPDYGGNIFRYGIPWQGIYDTWADHWHNDNIRLGNVLGTILLLFPKWVGSGLMLLAWMYTVLESFRLIGINIGRSAMVSIGLVMFGLMIPWSEMMGSFIFQINYVGATAMSVFLIQMLRKHRRSRSAGSGVLLFILAMFCGWWHEGFGVPLLGGILFLILVDKDFRNRQSYLVVAGLVVGTLILAKCPGVMNRGEIVKKNVQRFDLNNLIYFFSWRWTFWVFATLTAITLFTRKGRRSLAHPLILFLIVSGLVSLVIGMGCAIWRRSSWWSDFAFILCSLYMTKELCGSWMSRYRLSNLVVCVPLLLLLYANQAFVGYYSMEIRAQRDALLKHYREDPYTPFFGKVRAFPDMSWISGYMPAYLYYIDVQWQDSMYFRKGVEAEAETNGYYVIPEELEYVSDSVSQEMPGGGKVREYKGRYYLPEEDAKAVTGSIYVDFGKGMVRATAFFNPFTSKGDGKRYVWVLLNTNWYVSHFKTPKAFGPRQIE